MGFPAFNEKQAALILQIRRGAAHLNDALYATLFDHFTRNGEMPYAIAKAIEGDPYEWLESRIHDMSEREYFRLVYRLLS